MGSQPGMSGSLGPPMQTTVERTAEHTVKLTIEVPADRFAKDLDRTYRAIAREVKIPGFRPGKAPKPIIDAQVGQDVVLDEFVHASVPTYYRDAVTGEDLAPIGDPDVDVEQMEPGKPFIFTATVEVRPRLEFAEDDYTGVAATRPALVVTDDEVDQWVERLRRQFGELEPVQRPVIEGDFVTASVSVRRGGEPVDAQRDQGGPDLYPPGEVRGGIDRVHDPHAAGGIVIAALLLADDPVVRERLVDAFTHHPLDRRIGGGHQGAVGLVPDLEAIAPEVAQPDAGGLFRHLEREGQFLFEHVRRLPS